MAMPRQGRSIGVEVQSAYADTDLSKRKPPGIETGREIVKVLSVSPMQDDHDTLERFLCRSKWIIHKAFTLVSGVALLREKRAALVVCERDLLPGSWKEVLEQITLLPKPPYLIVTSLLADEYLWAEALNLGAYDVLPKPFDSAEVVRAFSSAWLHWNRQYGVAIEPLKTAKAAVA